MNLLILTKYNPFVASGAASNRLLGLLKGLLLYNYDITLLITGGYYDREEKKKYKKSGTIESIRYEYLSVYDNTTINKRRLYEYMLQNFICLKIKWVYNKFLKSLQSRCVIWIQQDIINYKIATSTNKSIAAKYFMEFNEFPDIHLHNNSTRFFWQKNMSNKANQYLSNYILPKLDGIALMTNALEQYFSDKIHVKTKTMHLPMTVDLNRFDINKKHEVLANVKSPYIAFVGSMNDAKDGVNILIESFIAIAPKYPEMQLCLFGFWAYDTEKHLKMIADANLGNRILYAKAIKEDEVIKVLMNATLLVLPRPDSYQARGGFPTKLGEYLATAKPVIATTVGEIPNYLKDKESVFFCQPGSVTSLVVAFHFALENSDVASQVGKEGRKVAENIFSTAVQSQRLNDFLSEL
jgi:glycosyltransferase involved in cell wall biosynthesis